MYLFPCKDLCLTLKQEEKRERDRKHAHSKRKGGANAVCVVVVVVLVLCIFRVRATHPFLMSGQANSRTLVMCVCDKDILHTCRRNAACIYMLCEYAVSVPRYENPHASKERAREAKNCVRFKKTASGGGGGC